MDSATHIFPEHYQGGQITQHSELHFFYFERILQLDNQPRYLVALLCVLLLSLDSRKVELG